MKPPPYTINRKILLYFNHLRLGTNLITNHILAKISHFLKIMAINHMVKKVIILIRLFNFYYICEQILNQRLYFKCRPDKDKL